MHDFDSLKDFKKVFFTEHGELLKNHKQISIDVIQSYIEDVSKSKENLMFAFIDNPEINSSNYHLFKYEKISLAEFTTLLNDDEISESDYKLKMIDNVHGTHSFFKIKETNYILRQIAKKFIEYKNFKWSVHSNIKIKLDVFSEIISLLKNVLIDIFEDNFDIKMYVPNYNSQRTNYSNETISLFKGQTDLIDLFFYLVENFVITDNRAVESTKYNQIYFYIDSLSDSNSINKTSYVKFVRENFLPRYRPTRINGKNEGHYMTLNNLAHIYKSNAI